MISQRALTLHLALTELEQPLVLSEFPDRLSLQKTVHLIQASGVHLGFVYNWYIHGPYSPTLTEEAFSLLNERRGDPTQHFADGWSLDAKSVQILDDLKLALSDLPNQEVDRSKQLEIVSSVLWALQRGWGVWNKPSAVHGKLVNTGKKDFTENQVRCALSWLKKYGLIPKTSP